MTKRVEQWICIRFCINLEHFSVETIWMIQEAAVMGNWWLEASSWQCGHSCITCRVEFFGETWNHASDSALPQPRFGALWLLAFPKAKITWNGRDFRLSMRFRKIWRGSWWRFQQRTLQSALDSGGDAGRTVWGPKVPTLKGTEASMSYVQCFLYLVSSSINVSSHVHLKLM